MRVRAERVRGERVTARRSAPTAVGPSAVIVDLTFSGASVPSALTLYEGGGTVTTTVSGGAMNTTVNAGGVGEAFWFDGNQGCLYTIPVAGDFDAVLTGFVRNLADDGLPTVGDGNFRIAGLAAHDPDRATELNYIHIGWGCTASVAITVETKNTVASVSDFDAAAGPTGAGQVWIRRRSQIFTCFSRPAQSGAWTLQNTYDRTAAPMADMLDVGIMPPYASVATHDMRIFVERLRITRP
jgi:hypothetical protein